MAWCKTVGEIYDALSDTDIDRFMGTQEIKDASYTYQRVIEKHIPAASIDNAVAAISQYGIACNKKGFEEGFRTAWNIIEEMRTNA